MGGRKEGGGEKESLCTIGFSTKFLPIQLHNNALPLILDGSLSMTAREIDLPLLILRESSARKISKVLISRTNYSLFLLPNRAQMNSAPRDLRSLRALDSVGSDRKRIGRKIRDGNETKLELFVPVFIVQLPLSLSPFFSTHLNSDQSLYTPFSLMLQSSPLLNPSVIPPRTLILVLESLHPARPSLPFTHIPNLSPLSQTHAFQPSLIRYEPTSFVLPIRKVFLQRFIRILRFLQLNLQTLLRKDIPNASSSSLVSKGERVGERETHPTITPDMIPLNKPVFLLIFNPLVLMNPLKKPAQVPAATPATLTLKVFSKERERETWKREFLSSD